MSQVADLARVLVGPAPVPPRYSLLVNATIIDDPDLHYLSGGAVWPYPSLDDGATHNPNATGTFREKIEGGTITSPTFGAFSVYVAETCTARGIGDDAEFQDRAVVALAALEAALVEQEFSEGLAMPSNPYLGDVNGAAGIIAGTFTPLEGMARLEKAIAETGKMGLIHADPGTTTAWASINVIERDGNQLRTVANGTPVVSGYGYLGMAPLGQSAPAADQGWTYATGPVQIRRTPIQLVPGSLKEALDRMSNTVTYRAERHYLVDWDTELQAAVLVDR